MKYVHELKENYSVRLTISGGKGANLHKLVRYGFNVPDGFIINTKAFDEFLHQHQIFSFIKKELTAVRVDNHESISIASKNIKQEIMRASIPNEILTQMEKILSRYDNQKFSVRSSGVFEDNSNNSWAGQFDSYLQVSRNEIEDKIKKCWASFFNSRAISYNIRAYRNFKKLKFAVVIQKMVESEKSGVAFSIDPKENDFSKMIIEATAGYGENLVSGRETPFIAIIDKKKKIILNKAVKTNQYSELLSLKELNLLIDQILKLEKRFKNPIDIEWAIANDKIYFLQIRPITGLGRITKSETRFTLYPDIRDYELTFKASGLSFMFTDILSYAYKYLNPLFTSTQAQFCQYTSNEKIDYATRSGMNWLGKSNGFEEYQAKFTKYYDTNILVLNEIIELRKLSKSSTFRFFQIISKFFRQYSRMDNYFTNLTYIYSEENPVIKRNLDLLSKFKDDARLWINNTAIEENGQLSRFIKRLSEEFTIKKEDLECYKVSELVGLFHGATSTVSDKEIENRRISFAIYFRSGQISYLTGSKSLEFVNKITLRQNEFFSSEIKGQVANKVQSIAKGKVRVINVDYSDLDKMNKEISDMVKGEILISEFTAPELISACRKAKAIVTDLGGMLSHAAIISRELKIPCLVATGNASKFLKTGDEITIDFDLGSVKIN